MADRKKNHYVPRFYMKRFGSTDRSIHLLNTRSMKAVQDASIADQCQRKNLYNTGLEDCLSELESFIARGINQATDADQANPEILRLLAATQYLRVPRENDPGKTAMEAVADRWLTWLLETNPDLQQADTSYQLTGNSIEMLLGLLRSTLDWMCDLKAQVVNVENPRFILGDKPVVIYNQYCELVEHYAGLGLICSGIQLFMPVSPTEYLLLYDGQVYDYVKSRPVTAADVETLNTFQLLQSESNVYFSSWNDHKRLFPHVQEVGRSLGLGWPRTIHCSDCPEDIIHIKTLMPNMGLDLSFLKVKRRAARRAIHRRRTNRRMPYGIGV